MSPCAKWCRWTLLKHMELLAMFCNCNQKQKKEKKLLLMKSDNFVAHFFMFHNTQWSGLGKSLQCFRIGYKIISTNCVPLITLQDLQGHQKQNGASSIMILPSSLETTLLCLCFVNHGQVLKIRFTKLQTCTKQNIQSIKLSHTFMFGMCWKTYLNGRTCKKWRNLHYQWKERPI